jgi:hypothetical protein
MSKKSKIFSKKTNSYLTNEICIDSEDLENKILKDINNHSFFNDLIEFMMNLELPNKYNSPLNKDKNQKYINIKFYHFLKDNKLTTKSPEHFIFDNIRHAFINFKEGGVLQMYQYREAEVWYPKIIIKNFIGIAKDIDTLENNITIYRGTSQREYDSNKFGQSWTLDKNVAEKFAFIHYKGNELYKNTLRIVIQAEIKKEYIYYYKIHDIEHEVIINSNTLNSNSVEIIKTKKI